MGAEARDAGVGFKNLPKINEKITVFDKIFLFLISFSEIFATFQIFAFGMLSRSLDRRPRVNAR